MFDRARGVFSLDGESRLSFLGSAAFTAFTIFTLGGAQACSSDGPTSTSAPHAGDASDDARLEDTHATQTDASSKQCSTLVDVSPHVPRKIRSSTAPTPAGGDIADGTYLLTEYEVFTADHFFEGTPQYTTLRFSNGFEEVASGKKPSYKWSIRIIDSKITRTIVCTDDDAISTGGPGEVIDYTATPTTYVEFSGGHANRTVETYTRQ